MQKKQMLFKTRGMNQDLSVSAFNPEFSFENKNLRLSTNEGNTTMSWVNEKGTSKIDLYSWDSPSTSTSIYGTPIGTAVINNTLVLFTAGSAGDKIYKLQYNSDKSKMLIKELYSGQLGFSDDRPIETLVSYESELVQKVYWTDGINQPRVINIASTNIRDDEHGGDTQFDFVPTLQLKEEVTVKKILGGNGMFAPGVIQYAFTYYRKYGQESNIFYTTPLYYISYRDRGAAPDDTRVENAFKITVTDVNEHFDFLRIYSIQRTSINGTPIVKRIQDIEIAGLSNVSQNDTRKVASYTDLGTSGDIVDPTELLYKGGEPIKVGTLEQKDDTLFMGNLVLDRQEIDMELRDAIKGASNEGWSTGAYRYFKPMEVSKTNYIYSNQLTAYKATGTSQALVATDISVPCAGFKGGDYYRCGVQFQHKSGKWSDPVYLGNKQVTTYPTESDGFIGIPVIQCTISNNTADRVITKLVGMGYVKARAVVVYPSQQDRVTLCQGVVNPTLFTTEQRTANGGLFAQSSWFFRTKIDGNAWESSSGAVAPTGSGTLVYANNALRGYNPASDTANIRQVEVQGDFENGGQYTNKYQVDQQFLTFHSPEVEFDNSMLISDFSGKSYRQAGTVTIIKTFSDINIQTSSPTINNEGSGFVYKSFVRNNSYGIVSGLFYDDFAVDDMDDDNIPWRPHPNQFSPGKWMVYLWNKEGSLNNDIDRPANNGTASAYLKKKVISNLRYATTSLNSSIPETALFNYSPQVFASDDVTALKMQIPSGQGSVAEGLYMGNIDTVLMPDNSDGMYFAYNDATQLNRKGNTPFTENAKWWKTYFDSTGNHWGLWYRHLDDNTYEWQNLSNVNIGNNYKDLLLKKGLVRIKYKSTPHIALWIEDVIFGNENLPVWSLPVIEITQSPAPTSIFGGESEDALKENAWIPCGEPVLLLNADGTAKSSVAFEYSYGDTYYQRWDCLKTYAFTPEDVNQVVEIGSFMLETHINIDGRYDRNRGQINNLNMSPRNFNLLNPVYSQINNFFSYRILDSDFYNNSTFPNQITWSKTKQSGADVDQWTNVTLASTMDMDGDKGKVNKLIRFNDQLLCFQDTGISQVLYNENVQIQSTEGVPIEIANSGKVQGKRYLSGTVGCSNKWSIVESPSGIYFMDSNDKSIYMFNGQLNNISVSNGFNSWCKQNILGDAVWNPENFGTSDNMGAFHAFYDKQNQDVLFVNKRTALAWSERVGAFTSFYDYGNAPWFCNLVDDGIWINKGYAQTDGTAYHLWKHRGGSEYCKFFNGQFDYEMTLICNPEPQLDKTFTNVEFRACVTGESSTENVFTPILPIKHLETWNEHQHGYTALGNKTGHAAMVHGGDDSALKRKFRIWRCDIPRNNCLLDSGTGSDYRQAGVTYPYSLDSSLGVSRYYRKPNDRMRNTWLYMKLWKDANVNDNTTSRAEIHDVMVTYFT